MCIRDRVLSGKKPIGPLLQDDKAVRWGKSPRAKLATRSTHSRAASQQYFEPITAEQAGVEDGPSSTMRA
eukprot:9429945-Alexandrium_andersonii.AAC.1